MRIRALLIAGILATAAACASVARLVDRDVRVLVYNIHAGRDAAGDDNLERVAEIVRRARADIVLLQEVDSVTTRSGRVDQLARLMAATRLYGVFGKTLDYQGGGYGIATLSRWPISTDTLMRLPVEPPQQRAGGSYEPRGALRATVRSPWGELHVLNTHLDASTGDEYRMQEARVLAALASGSRARGPTLVGGDLNATPESNVLALLQRDGWVDPWPSCGKGEGGGRTYPAREPVKRIDYLLPNGRWVCREAWVYDTEASDHRPTLYVLSPSSR